MATVKRRLEKLETRARAQSFNNDVFDGIEKDSRRLEWYELTGRWPAEMTEAEINEFERDLKLMECA